MATLFKPMDVQVDGNGLSMAGAKLYFYITGTSTPQDTYSQSDLAIGHVNPNPVVANADGLWPPIYLGATDYKAILKTSADVTVLTLDPVLVNPAAATLSEDFDDQFGSTEDSLLQRGATEWEAVTTKAVLDAKFGTDQGTIIYRGASDWTVLATPADRSFLTIAGPDVNPSWQRHAYFYGTVAAGALTQRKASGMSVVRSGAGTFTCTISTAMPDAFYRVMGTTAMDLSGGAGQAPSVAEDQDAGSRTTTTFYLICRDDTIGTQDPDAISIEVFG